VTVVLRPAAAADVEAAYRWYERRRAGLGDRFLDAVASALRAIDASPGTHAVVHRGTRRALVRRFPYAIFYRIAGGHVVIVACMHARRDPTRWRGRL
jgi:toxin ParE1/3/4